MQIFPGRDFQKGIQPHDKIIAMSNNFDRLTSTLPPIPGIKAVGTSTFICAGVIAMTTLLRSLLGEQCCFLTNWGLMRETLSSPLQESI